MVFIYYVSFTLPKTLGSRYHEEPYFKGEEQRGGGLRGTNS